MSVLWSCLVYTAPKWPINQLMENAERNVELFISHYLMLVSLFG